MAGPRNNLDEVLRNLQQPATPKFKPASSLPQPAASKSKFKPAAKSTPVSSVPSTVTVRKTASYTSFATPGFGRTKPASLQSSDNSQSSTELVENTTGHVSRPYQSSRAPSAFSPALPSPSSSSSLSGTSRLTGPSIPEKRSSPFPAVQPSPKRSRPSLELEKENMFKTEETQLIDASDRRDDSGYVSFTDKGKGRDVSHLGSDARGRSPLPSMPLSPRRQQRYHSPVVTLQTISRPASVVTSSAVTHPPSGSLDTSVQRHFSLDSAPLLSMQLADLQEHKSKIVDIRSQLMDARSFDSDPAAVETTNFLRHIDEIMQDRIQCIDALINASKTGQERRLPVTKWVVSPPHRGTGLRADSSTGTDSPQTRFLQPVMERSGSTSSTTLDDDFPTVVNYNFQANSAQKDVITIESDEDEDVMWGQLESVDHRGPNTSTHAETSTTIPPRVPPVAPSSEPSADLVKSPHYSRIVKVLNSVFKLTSFRMNQLEAITAHMDGHDVFVLMPTGGGKSLCFQLPAVLRNQDNDAVTFVVSPLVSLMLDQVTALQRLGVSIAHFSTHQTRLEYEQMHSRLHASKKPSLVYVTPEKLEHSNRLRDDMRALYKSGKLGGIVVDEAHCITTWGRSFRESYTKLEWMRQEFPKAPFTALTATANRQAVEDIISRLGITGCKRFSMSFNRSNLFYEVCSRGGDAAAIKDIVHFIKTKFPGKTGIIYYNNKKKCEYMAEILRNEHGLSAAHYHADMSVEDKASLQREWQADRVKIIIATVAFGMGIDKADVRFVIHWGTPGSLSNYYQETGRAGRDGKPSHCRLYYNASDSRFPIKSIRQEIQDPVDREDAIQNILRVVQYCTNNVDCRRVQVLGYFDERFRKDDCQGKCDNCSNTTEVIEEDVTESAQQLIQLALEAGGGKVTRTMLVEIFIGKLTSSNKNRGFERFASFAVGKDVAKARAERIFDQLYGMGVLDQETEARGDSQWSADYVTVPRRAYDFINSGERLVMGFRIPPPKGRAKKAARTQDTSADDPVPSRQRSKRGKVKATEIPEDPISLYASDEEDESIPVQADSHFQTPALDDYDGFDVQADADTTTDVMQDCRQALERKLEELQYQTSEDLTVIFTEEVLDLISITLPSDIHTFRAELASVADLDMQAAQPFLAPLLTVCIKAKAKLAKAEGSHSRGKPPSVQELREYEYRQLKPTSSRGRKS